MLATNLYIKLQLNVFTLWVNLPAPPPSPPYPPKSRFPSKAISITDCKSSLSPGLIQWNTLVSKTY